MNVYDIFYVQDTIEVLIHLFETYINKFHQYHKINIEWLLKNVWKCQVISIGAKKILQKITNLYYFKKLVKMIMIDKINPESGPYQFFRYELIFGVYVNTSFSKKQLKIIDKHILPFEKERATKTIKNYIPVDYVNPILIKVIKVVSTKFTTKNLTKLSSFFI